MSGAAPTGCYKCGRPGHWSRDCPSSSNSNSEPNPNPKSSNFPNSFSFSSKPSTNYSQKPGAAKSAEKPKKVPKTRPKLTPELLLSDNGLGYILRHFPRNFKFRGRGHEVNDLKNLLRMYSDWHSQLLPYYPFEQFIQKVEQVGTGKRVKLCLRELRERVANGGDPSTWKDPTTEQETPMEQDDPNSQEKPTQNPSSEAMDADDQQEAFLNEIFGQTVHEENNGVENGIRDSVNQEKDDHASPEKSAVNETRAASKTPMSEEQRARMEANKLKAMEKAMARKRTLTIA